METRKSAGLLPSPSSPRPQEISSSEPRNSQDDFLPPITTASLPTALQSRIASQEWDAVSARQPIGCPESERDRDAFQAFASTILETRLVDVVRHRRDIKQSSSTPGLPTRSPRTSNDEWLLVEGGGGSSPASADSLSSPPVLLTSNCRYQLRAYVRRIASMYRNNRYHGLEHAVHVTMSANKLLEMLHDGAIESNDDAEMNDFSVSEPCIMKEAASKKLESRARNDSVDSIDSLLSENGYKKSRGSYAGALQRTIPSDDFEGRAAHQSVGPSEVLLRPSKKKRPKLTSHRPGVGGSGAHLIYSDTFTKFAFVFAAMIHDVDHQGVPNTRLVLEGDPVVAVHGAISAAEKHSIKVAFRTLGEGEFDEFRAVVFESPDDQLRMHRIVTNVVVSTDIANPERMQSTRMRWEDAFAGPLPAHGPVPFGRLSLAGRSPPSEIATVQASLPRLVPMQNTGVAAQHHHSRHQRRNSLTKRVLQLNGGQTVEYFTEHSEDDDEKRAALRHSVVIETMLNVADVAHSMQSWELFCFWNRKLFEELYFAFKTGRSGNDPSDGWYENQLGFYRLYVIPLAEKMKTCRVFGKRGGEWAKNAILIRDRWSREGGRVTENMITSVKRDMEPLIKRWYR